MKALAAMLAVGAVLVVAGAAQADGLGTCVGAPSDFYGTAGPYAAQIATVPNPTSSQTVSVYSPTTGSGPWPVVFFSHGLGAKDAETYYPDVIRRIVSRGAVVVYSPYVVPGASEAAAKDAYEQLWAGFDKAVQVYAGSAHMDLSRVGFWGHSFGGGATPEMFRRGVAAGWGSNARFMLMFAPYRVWDITDAQLAALPADTKMLIQAYDDDTVVDHQFGIEQIWKKATSIPSANRDYELVRTATNGACSLPADHGVPVSTGGSFGKLDDYDPWAVWRQTAAMMGCTFDHDPAGCAIALGHGSAQQTTLGNWLSDGTPVTPIQSMWDGPVPTNCQPGETCTTRYTPPTTSTPPSTTPTTAAPAPSPSSGSDGSTPAPVTTTTTLPTTSPTADFAAATNVAAKLAGAKLTLTNANGFAVSAVVAVVAKLAHRAREASSARVAVGAGTVPAGGSTTIKLRLTAKGRALLRHHKRLAVTLATTLRSPTGATRTLTTRGTLR